MAPWPHVHVDAEFAGKELIRLVERVRVAAVKPQPLAAVRVRMGRTHPITSCRTKSARSSNAPGAVAPAKARSPLSAHRRRRTDRDAGERGRRRQNLPLRFHRWLCDEDRRARREPPPG